MFSATTRRLIQYVGSVKLEDFTNLALREAVNTFCEQQEQANPKAKAAEIKGTTLHQSHDDPGDTQPVISIRFKDEDDRRIGTGHVHEDGTGKVNWK